MRKALLVGIDHYNFQPLNGCVNDATTLGKLIEYHDNEDRNFEIQLLLSSQKEVSRKLLREEISCFFEDDADVIDMGLFFFAGHGVSQNCEGILVTQDASKFDEGVGMDEVIQLANKSTIPEIVLIFDCCYSGKLGVNNNTGWSTELRKGVSVLSSCGPNQAAKEQDGGGVFTNIIRGALEGGAADLLGHITVAGVYNFADRMLGAFDQRPIFKSHVTQMTTLRRANSRIGLKSLRQIIKIFPDKDFNFPLNKEYEPAFKGKDKEKHTTFRLLQRYTRLSLVEPVDAEHMYDAAEQSKSCILTGLGKFYWELVKRDRI